MNLIGKSQRQQQQQQARREAGTRSRDLGRIIIAKSICIKLRIEYSLGAQETVIADRPPKYKNRVSNLLIRGLLVNLIESGSAHPQGRCDVQQHIRHARLVRDELIGFTILIRKFPVKRFRTCSNRAYATSIL
jgi:hypothetical protein